MSHFSYCKQLNPGKISLGTRLVFEVSDEKLEGKPGLVIYCSANYCHTLSVNGTNYSWIVLLNDLWQVAFIPTS